MVSACACTGIMDGNKYCFCIMKQMGLDTSMYEWTEEEKQKLNEAFSKMFEWKPNNG